MSRFRDPFDRRNWGAGFAAVAKRPVRASGPGIAQLVAPADGYAAYAGIGSRETPAGVCDLMRRIASVLEARGHILRSGGAPSADQAFEAYVGSPAAREIFPPWKRFEQRTGIVITDLDIAIRAEAIAREHHPAWDRCSRGASALHARNVHQVLGRGLDPPAGFVICCTADGQASGGTGQALRIAKGRGVPILNLYDAHVADGIRAELGL